MTQNHLLLEHYNQRNEDSRLTSKHGAVEFIVTTHYINKYLKPGDRMLEIGCATGRYTLHYARQGFEVDAIELSQSHLDVLWQHQRPEDKVRAVQGTALDLSRYEDATFDITLVFGPMYHLYTLKDQLRCLAEAIRVTKPSGTIFVAYCQFDASMVQYGFIKGGYDFLVKNNLLDTQTFLPISSPAGIFELYRREKVDELNAYFAVNRLHYVGTDMFTMYMAQQINAMDEAMYAAYLQYTLSICENPHLVGLSNHALDICAYSFFLSHY